MLQKEANLPQIRPQLPNNTLSPFAYNLNKVKLYQCKHCFTNRKDYRVYVPQGRLSNAIESKHMKPVPQEQNNVDMRSPVSSKFNAPLCGSSPVTPIRVNLNKLVNS
jgi:hypothetical protein